MKLKVKAEKLNQKRFDEALKIMRLWPEYQRTIAHDLLKHVQYLNEEILKLESEIRGYKEIQFFEEAKKIEIKKSIVEESPHLSRSLKPTDRTYTTKGERYYHLLFTRSHDAYLRLNPSLNIDDMLAIANEYAEAYSKTLLTKGDFNEPIFSNRFANAQEPSLI